MCSIAQALPCSLRVLEAFCVHTEVLMQLTALERLTLASMLGTTERPTCSLSALRRLTFLDLQFVNEEDLHVAAGCPGLRTLCLNGE
jgi:hypothetical protein